MGMARAWLPSRRSTEHHLGAAVIDLSGQVLSLRPIFGNSLYLLTFVSSFVVSLKKRRAARAFQALIFQHKKNPLPERQRALKTVLDDSLHAYTFPSLCRG
jgi:hypothetical protein